MTEKHPSISVYVTTYNLQKYVGHCLDSVLHQSLVPTEIIVIDDCSSDDTLKIVKEYQSKHQHLIQVFQNETNKGIAYNRNKALSIAKGELICGIDGDDTWEADKLRQESTLLMNQEVDFVFSNHKVIDMNGSGVGDPDKGVLEWPLPEDMFANILMRRSGPMLFRSELVRTDVLRSLGGYDEELRIFEDYDLKIRLGQKHSGAGIQRVLHSYRTNPNGLSKSGKWEFFIALRHILEKHRNKKHTNHVSGFNDYIIEKYDELLLGALTNKEISITQCIKELLRSKAGKRKTWWTLIKHGLKN